MECKYRYFLTKADAERFVQENLNGNLRYRIICNNPYYGYRTFKAKYYGIRPWTVKFYYENVPDEYLTTICDVLSYGECEDIIKNSIFAMSEVRSAISCYTAYYFDGGCVQKKSFFLDRLEAGSEKLRKMCVKTKREFGRVYFNDDQYMLHLGNAFIARMLDKCVGKTFDSVEIEVKKYQKERVNKFIESVQATTRWKEFRKKYGDYVIGVDNDVDVYPTGFSVRVLFKTDKSFEERKKFVKSHSKEIIEYVIGELEDSKRAMRRIGDMKFYKPVLIATLRAAEADVKFEVKREIV